MANASDTVTPARGPSEAAIPSAGTLPELADDEAAEAQGEGGEEEIDPEAGDGGEEEAGALPEGFEEIEVDGEIYAVPKTLKSRVLMHGDYTQKTQALAEDRRRVEAREAEIAQEAEALQHDTEDRARVFWLDQQIAPYAKMTPDDWSKFEDNDPIGASKHWRYYQSLKDHRGEVATRIDKNARERAEKADADLHTRVQETYRVLARDIKGWSNEIVQQLTDYGLSQGFTQAELQGLNTDARAIKLLHKAFERDQLVKKQQQVAQRGPAAQQRAIPIKPLATVTRRQSRPAASAAPSDKDSDDEWLRKRRAQLAKQKG